MKLADANEAILSCRISRGHEHLIVRAQEVLTTRAGVPVSRSAAVRFLLQAGSRAVADGRHVALAAPAGVAGPR